MLTQLSTVKSRLAIAPADITHDPILTAFIAAASARFDRECRRTLARTVDATHEFRADETQIILSSYPLETLGKFEIKSSEAEGWVLQTPDHLIRRRCVVSLFAPMGTVHQLGRITYTAGYVLPGDLDPQPSTINYQPVRLPADLEHAAIEQVCAWFQKKDKLGLVRHWPNAGTYDVLSLAPLLSSVQAALRRYERWLF